MPAKKTLQARGTFGFPDQRHHANHKELASQVALEKLRIEAAIGRNTLEGVPPLYRHADVCILRYWADNGAGDTLHEINIKPVDQVIAVSGLRGSTTVFDIRIDIPGEIVGTGLSEDQNQGGRYKGLFFSTERGERNGNLFSVVNLVANAIVMERHGLIVDAGLDVEINQENDDEEDRMRA